MRIAFIGLGVMGCPMAGLLAGVGNEVTVSGAALQLGTILILSGT